MTLNGGRTNKAERQREDEAEGWCTLIRMGRLGEYLEWLEKRPKKEIINRFLGIINTKSSHLPIVFAEEKPPVVIDGVSVDPIQNTVARRAVKISLLLLVHDESKKLGIWDQIQPQWTEKYILEAKTQDQIMEAMAKEYENTGQESRAAEIRKNIEDAKEANKKLGIDY
ncbi:MAG: hypothetical protein E3J92_01605 [Dehalococcoidia bacterium]|nr:MAG: hypothetical protein E3J92_01605 [Dehalococcoidia bacterium]